MHLILALVILTQTTPAPSLKVCPANDHRCIDAQVDEALRYIEAAKVRKQRQRSAQLPQCPMWVSDTYNAECV